MAISNCPFTYRRKTRVKSEPILKNSQIFLGNFYIDLFRPLFWTESVLEFGHRNP